MLSLIERYLLKEVSRTWVVVAGVLCLILISNQLARVLGDAVEGDIPKSVVFQILALSSVGYLTILIPLATFLASLLALGRWYRDHEVDAMLACRGNPNHLLVPVMFFAALISLPLTWFALDFAPRSAAAVDNVVSEHAESLLAGGFSSGRFLILPNQAGVAYAEQVSEGQNLENVFIQRRNGREVELVVAERGRMEQLENDDRRLVLYNGARYEGVSGESQFRVIRFGEHGVPIVTRAKKKNNQKFENFTFPQLLAAGSSPEASAELHWRIGSVVSIFVLAFLAVAMSRSSPRQGQYGKLFLGVLIYLVYSNLLGVGQVWLQESVVPGWLGLWWVHFGFFAVALILMKRHYQLS